MLQYFRRSFSARLSLWVTGFVTIIFVVALILLFRFSLAVAQDESQERIMQVLEHAALQADHVLHQTELTASTTTWMIQEHLSKPDSIPVLCQKVIQANPWIDSCYIADVSIAPSDTAYWYEPSLDTMTGEIPLQPMVISYRHPIFDTQGHRATTLVMDVKVDWTDLTTVIAENAPYAHCFLWGKKGHDQFAESGYRQLLIDGEKAFEFYRPFRKGHWGLALICPEQQILSDYYRLMNIAVGVAVIVLLLLLFTCRRIIDHNLSSLDDLSDIVRRISQNQFDEPIPNRDRKDEIGELHRSFSQMQQALTNHINELHQKTEALKQRNEELKAAYERGREDERTKAAFLSHTTSQIMPPANVVNTTTNILSAKYQTITKEEMTLLKTQITESSDTITRLIDEMLTASQKTDENSSAL